MTTEEAMFAGNPQASSRMVSEVLGTAHFVCSSEAFKDEQLPAGQGEGRCSAHWRAWPGGHAEASLLVPIPCRPLVSRLGLPQPWL